MRRPDHGRLRLLLTPGLLLALVMAAGAVSAAAPPQVTAAGEALVGEWELGGRVMAFKGVPFAAPPVGAGRWMPPAPHLPRPGLVAANQFAPACIQDAYNMNWYRRVGAAFGAEPWEFVQPAVSEDCLYLNVWAPVSTSAGPLPVMVWIYGGSNRSGWSFEPNYRGAALAARGVVVVTLAYRVGILGFFGHAELAEELGLNFGLRDQIAALEWVNRSIATFGGDPDNVTVFGESAGASNIGYLVNSPLAAPLFRRAVSQSGGFQMQYDLQPADARALGSRVADALGAEDLAALRAVPAAALFDAAIKASPDGPWRPVVDGVTVLASPAANYQSAGIPHDLMIGRNADEQYMYLPQEPSGLADALQAFPAAAVEILKPLVVGDGDPRLGYDRAITLAEMTCPAYLMAGSAVAAGRRAWVYEFERQRPGPGGEALRAYHGAEIPYVFDTHDPWFPASEQDEALTNTMMSFWVQFASVGDPNSEGLPQWPEYHPDRPQIMALGNAPAPREAQDLDTCLALAPTLYPGWQAVPGP